MTQAERNRAIKKLMERRTAEITVSRKAAREALIEEGVYTKKGALRAEYGGKSTKRRRIA